MAKKSVGRPACNKHSDCYANKKGSCVCLSDNDFGKRDCPFYKPNNEANLEQINAECKVYAQSHGGGCD